jgi:large subunit ribosomal protein L19
MKKIPEIKPGDLVKIYAKIIEGDKERLAPFQGVVIQIKGSDDRKTVTVRKISAGVGVERIFPIYSPIITKIEIKKRGETRKARLTYLRHKKGRKIKLRGKEAEREEIDAELVEKPTQEQEVPKPEKKEVKKTEEKPVEGTPGEKSVEKV